MDKDLCSYLERGITQPEAAVEEFEAVFAEYAGVKYALAVDSGTAALHLALACLGVKKGDTVLMPDFVCTALLNAVKYTGAEPCIADVGDDFNITPETVKKTLRSKKVRMMIVPHMFGKSCRIDEMSVPGIPLIEDFTFTVGGEYKGRKSGSFGDIGVCSLGRTKVFTVEKGGLLLTSDRALYERARDLSYYDKKDRYYVCFNYRMNGLTAALGLHFMKKFPGQIEKRKKLAEVYYRALEGVAGLNLPSRTGGHLYSRFVVTGRESLRKRLVRAGVNAQKPIYKPLHRYLGRADGSFPKSTYLYENSFCLPLYPHMKKESIEKISAVVKSVFLTKKRKT